MLVILNPQYSRQMFRLDDRIAWYRRCILRYKYTTTIFTEVIPKFNSISHVDMPARRTRYLQAFNCHTGVSTPRALSFMIYQGCNNHTITLIHYRAIGGLCYAVNLAIWLLSGMFSCGNADREIHRVLWLSESIIPVYIGIRYTMPVLCLYTPIAMCTDQYLIYAANINSDSHVTL